MRHQTVPVAPEEVLAWFMDVPIKSKVIPSFEDCTSISAQLDLIAAVPGIRHKQRAPTPVEDALNLIRTRIPLAKAHWAAEMDAGRLDQSDALGRLQWLKQLEIAIRLAPPDWLLESVPKPTELQHHVRARRIAFYVARALRKAGDKRVSDGADSALVSVVCAALRRIGDQRSDGAAIERTAISQYLRGHRPADGWGRDNLLG